MKMVGKRYDSITKRVKKGNPYVKYAHVQDIKMINIKSEGNFFGYVFERRVHGNGKRDSRIILPKEFAGRVYTLIMIPQELNRKIMENGESINPLKYMQSLQKDDEYDLGIGGQIKYKHRDNIKPTKIEISEQEVKL